jgi:hypothetical protein
VRIELLLDHGLSTGLLARRLMAGLKLYLAALADSDHGNILDSLYDAKIAHGHDHSLPQFTQREVFFASLRNLLAHFAVKGLISARQRQIL